MKNKLASCIDHTLLKPKATHEQVLKLCEEAKEHGFASVCVNPHWVRFCKAQGVRVCTVIGFPEGDDITEEKVAEAKQAISDGAEELDMVINVERLKAKDYDFVKKEIVEIVKLGKLVKVIIETCLLNKTEKKKACELAQEAGADFVKTSTGFSEGGATVADVKLMKKYLPVKASGGIKTKADALKMIKAGATRIGASSGVEIIE